MGNAVAAAASDALLALTATASAATAAQRTAIAPERRVTICLRWFTIIASLR